MKRIAVILISLQLAGLLLVACAGKGAPTPTPMPIKVRIGTSATYPPFESIDNTKKEMIGFDIDLMKAIATKANLDLEFVNSNYDQMLSDVAACRLDGAIAAIPVADELKKQMSFSSPYITFGQVIVVQESNSTITGIDKLADMTVGAQIGSQGLTEVKKVANAKLKSFQSIDTAFQELSYGLIDAVVADWPYALASVNVPANKLKIAGKEFAKQDFAIAVCNQRTSLVDRINTAIRGLKFDGTVEKLTNQWINNSK